MLGFYLSLFFAIVFGKIEELKKQIRDLKIDFRVKEKIAKLNCNDRESLISKKRETETAINNLLKLSYSRGLSAKEDEKLDMSFRFVGQIDFLINNNSNLK